MDRWIVGSLDRWIVGSLDRWIVGSLDRWIVGSLDRWIVLKRIITTFFLSLALAGCGGSGGGGSSSSGGGQGSTPTTVYLWVANSITDSDGDYFAGGPAVANAFCAAAAVNQGITFATPVNTHWGMLAFPSSVPRDFFSTNPAAERPDGTPIVSNYADFFDASVTLTNAVRTGASRYIWSGMDVTGSYAGDSWNCEGWTSDHTFEQGLLGKTTDTSINRINSSNGVYDCDQPLGIYCVSFQN